MAWRSCGGSRCRASTPPAASARSQPPRAITTSDSFSVGDFSFSPDGTKIAFSAQRDPDLISAATSALYTVTLAEGTVKKIVDAPGPQHRSALVARRRPDRLPRAPGAKYFFYANQKVAVVAADGGPVKVLNPAFDEDAAILRWAPEGIYFAAREGTNAGLYLLDPKAPAVKKVTIPGSDSAVRFSFSDDFRRVAYVGAGANQVAEIYASPLPGAAPVQLTHGSDQFAGLAIARRELVRWKSGDGAQIEGVLYKPADFDPRRRYPLLVVIHGGPTGIDTPTVGPDRYYRSSASSRRCALVLRPNYRGSAGYGEKFRALNVRNLGVGDYADVISGVDSLIAKGFVDRDRVGAMGWSEGGYISAFITTSSDRFKAVSVGACISDWMTYYANTDITPFTPQYLRAPRGRTEDLRADLADHLCGQGEDADPDPARRGRQARADRQRLRASPGAGRPRRAGQDGRLRRLRTPYQQAEAATRGDGGKRELVRPLHSSASRWPRRSRRCPPRRPRIGTKAKLRRYPSWDASEYRHGQPRPSTSENRG